MPAGLSPNHWVVMGRRGVSDTQRDHGKGHAESEDSPLNAATTAFVASQVPLDTVIWPMPKRPMLVGEALVVIN